MPNQTCVTEREPHQLPPVLTWRNSANERRLAYGERRSGILCQLSFAWTYRLHLTHNAKTFHRENMFHR